MKILFATSEVHPLVKTGGLADVSFSLPLALSGLRHDIRIILPAYRCLNESGEKKLLLSSQTESGDSYRLLETRLPGTQIPVYLADCPELFDRPGGPYGDEQGQDWPDNAHRFAAFAEVITQLATHPHLLDWQPDVIHCNDWQTGLVPVKLRNRTHPPVLFTIHNLAYQGVFPRSSFEQLGLEEELWNMYALEFYNQYSFMKGGLVFSDWVTTVSPTYAREIMTPEFGNGLEGVLQERAMQVTGIINGIDTDTWDPRKDTLIPHTYNARKLSDKRPDKAALQKHFGLPQGQGPLFGSIGRLVEQKGIDLLIDILPGLLDSDWQFIILGTGDPDIEKHLQKLARQFPNSLGVHIGYDETTAHLIEAGADCFVMPSRFEPCGMNQMYSMRYGTLPVVHRTGGLADTVICADEQTLADHSATGFGFDHPDSAALHAALEQAAACFRDKRLWQQMMRAAMRQDFSWSNSARQYLALYQRISG